MNRYQEFADVMSMNKQKALNLMAWLVTFFPIATIAVIIVKAELLPIANVTLFISPYIGYALLSIFCGSQLLKRQEKNEKYVLRNCLLLAANVFQVLTWTSYYLLKFTSFDRNSYGLIFFFAVYFVFSIMIYRRLKVYFLEQNNT